MTKQQTAGQRIIASAKEALTFAQADDNGCVVHAPKAMDAVRIRKKIKMSQSQFAKYFGVSVCTVQEWEQGRAVPSGRNDNLNLTTFDNRILTTPGW